MFVKLEEKIFTKFIYWTKVNIANTFVSMIKNPNKYL